MSEEVSNKVELGDNDIQERENPNIDAHKNQLIEESNNYAIKSIYDPSPWTNIDTDLRELLIRKGPIKITDPKFPKDKISRHFSFVLRSVDISPNPIKNTSEKGLFEVIIDEIKCIGLDINNLRG
ncbi:hypothetical protein CDL12_25042 [Handroanthus impetiginosus]|uniref:Uncharacterized protein n=1 Tax=Handroanthus impetiginosus TaxID=429701 RepID=A0A2G9GAZ7_9LAMI|nr:hypothetical protein CDL12_25042 [Handroanthus impetiginosus]